MRLVQFCEKSFTNTSFIMKLSNNLVVQIVSLLLWIVALAGLKVNPETVGDDLVTSISTQNWSLLLIIIFNLGNSAFSWIRTWSTDKPNFLQFLRSPNWWISACNIGFAALAMRGIYVPAEASAQIVDFIFKGQWYALAGYLIPNVIGPVIRAVLDRKTSTPTA